MKPKTKPKAQRTSRKNTKKVLFGFSLIELLIAITVLAILILLVLISLPKQVSRSRDAQRKADLERIKVAFEDYYNDNQCYPPPDVLENCRSNGFQPYLHAIPCDPLSDEPYMYVPLSPDGCRGYRVFSELEVPDDPVIEEMGCEGEQGCGYGYNYGIAAGVPVLDPTASPLPTPTPPVPSPTGIIYVYACDAAGACNRYEDGHPYLIYCPVTYKSTDCDGQCGNPAVRCGGWCFVRII